jgi:hypothetical protein
MILLAAGVALALPSAASAQSAQWPEAPPPAAPKGAKQAPRAEPQQDVEELTPSQIQRAQEPERPAAQPKQTEPKQAAPKPQPSAQPPAQAARAVACSGAFAKGSSHLGLFAIYKDNVAFTEVDAPEGKKVMASVIFPKDPKRRLEVWWENEASRSGTYLIVIGGQSTWSAPKGLKLGLQFGALEKLNGKPFKVTGFDKDTVGQVSDWQGGALAQLPGGCKAGVFLRPDPKAPAEAREALATGTEYVSTDPSLRAAKPVIAEIILGY